MNLNQLSTEEKAKVLDNFISYIESKRFAVISSYNISIVLYEISQKVIEESLNKDAYECGKESGK